MSDPHHGISWNTRHLADLDFADNLALLGETTKSLESITENLACTAAKVGLRIGTEKNKLMSVKGEQPIILWLDHVTNDVVRQRSEIVKERHLKMPGHIPRMPEERLPKHQWIRHLLEIKEKGADYSPPEKEQYNKTF